MLKMKRFLERWQVISLWDLREGDVSGELNVTIFVDIVDDSVPNLDMLL